MNGEKIGGLAGNGLPGLARVGAAEQVAVSAIGRADVNRLSRMAASAGAGIEDHEAQPRAAASPAPASAATTAARACCRVGRSSRSARFGARAGRVGGCGCEAGGKLLTLLQVSAASLLIQSPAAREPK